MRRVRIGIDTGGTFTDVVAVDEESGELAVTKTPSTPADPAEGFMTGVHKVLGELGLDGGAVSAVSHGTTVATNKLLEGKVAEPRLHHHRGLRVPARDRPAVGARRLRQLLLLGEARPHRAGRPGADGRRTARGRRLRGPPLRRAGCGRGGAMVPRPGHRHHRRLLPARVRRRPARARHARRAGPRAPRRRGVDQQRGAARVPRVRAGADHAGRRRRQTRHPSLRRHHRRAAGRARRRRGRRRRDGWRPVLRDEVQRRGAERGGGGASAHHDGALGTGGRRPRSRRRGGGGRLLAAW